MSGQSGKGNSSAATTQNVSNQQVATESGIAIGANSKADINVNTLDPEVAKAAIAGNVLANRDSLVFAGHAAEVSADVNKFSTLAVSNIASASILGQNELATKFIEGAGDLAAQNVNLLQSLNQQQTDVALRSLGTANDALTQSFAVSRATAPQDANYTVTSAIKYIAIALAVVFGAMFIFRKKA